MGGETMSQLQHERTWDDPASWSFGVVYRAPSDPRWIVPLRNTNAGWTPNVAHINGVVLAIAIVVAALAPAFTAWLLGRLGEPVVSLGSILWFIACVLPVGAAVRTRAG